MKILLLGKDGQVGWELQRALAPLGQLLAVGRAQCNLADADNIRAVVRDATPAVIVNAAAYTAVDKAEGDVDLARAINGIAPGILAEEAKKRDALLVHYSTDYVFDGSKTGAYLETDATNPLSVYGATKLDGERAIQETECRHLIFRTSWVFAARGANFAKTILRLAREREALKIVGDQFGAPTSAELIADVTALCVRNVFGPQGAERLGLYHLAASGETTWHGYARYIVAQAAQNECEPLKCYADGIEAIPTSGYPLPAARPANSRLDTTKLKAAFDVVLPDWTYHAERMLTEILNKEN